jgi:biotin operon repressor
MTDLQTAAQQALEALIHMCHNTFAQKGYDGQRVQNAIDGLEAALEQQEPRNQCGETCERAKLCAVCARGLEQEPLSVEDLARALVASRVIDAAAIDDPEGYDDGVMLERLRGLHRRLAQQEQQEQEPVAWRYKGMMGMPWSLSDDGYYVSCKRDKGYTVEPLFTHPPRREWVSLTPDAVFASDEIMSANASLGLRIDQLMDLVHAIEQTCKEKNQ